jgi:predicted AAA+ superfamily ATPase
MDSIGKAEIARRLAQHNLWWSEPLRSALPEGASPKRVYFAPFKALALNFGVRRATILLGPRRVGKTFMVKQLIHDAIQDGFDPDAILYAAMDTPIYAGISLEQFLDLFPKDKGAARRLVIFDEIQYFWNWEVHLKNLVDNHVNTKFIALGSAAAALKLKSAESGAGRFSDFMLPPLTFYEFLKFLNEEDKLIDVKIKNKVGREYAAKDINELNKRFVDYLNFGGYPEAVLDPQIRGNSEQFIRNDIIDKVLLKDLPSLYGINDIQQLNRLFSFLAYNAGNEASLENISQKSGVSKPTIQRYIKYLESAFLIIKLPTVDENCKTLQRQRNFKVYLNNPSMRAALFGTVRIDETAKIGHLAESAIFSQWQHAQQFRQLRYARWKNEGEVDVVYLSPEQPKPLWIGEISWSDDVASKYGDATRSMATLLKHHKKTIKSAFLTTKTLTTATEIEGLRVAIWPTALYCYFVGRNITTNLEKLMLEEFMQQGVANT